MSDELPPFHPAADAFPLMTDLEIESLAADIRKHGQRVPIVMYKGSILDGRNRWRACIRAGKEPVTVEWQPAEGESPLRYSLSLNLERRQLTPTQKAFVALKLEELFAEEARERMAEGTRRSHEARGVGEYAGGLGNFAQATSEYKNSINCDAPNKQSLSVLSPKVGGSLEYDQERKARVLTEEQKLTEGRRSEIEKQREIQRARVQAAFAVGVGDRYVQEAKVIARRAPEIAPLAEAGKLEMQAAKKIAKLQPEARTQVIAKLQSDIDVKVDEAIREVTAKAATERRVIEAKTKYAVIYSDAPVPPEHFTTDSIWYYSAPRNKLLSVIEVIRSTGFAYRSLLVIHVDKKKQIDRIIIIGTKGNPNINMPEDDILAPSEVFSAMERASDGKYAYMGAVGERRGWTDLLSGTVIETVIGERG